MKKALLVLVAGLMTASAYAQANGNIIFANRNVPTVSGTGGGNGNGTYNIPLWEPDANGPLIKNIGNGAGDLAGGVTVGLFQAGGTTPLATTLLRTDANSQFFATSATPVDIPGVAPGATASLVVRAWQGAGGFDAAKSGGLAFHESSFTSRPLGGTPPQPGSTPVPTPNMTGWGPEDGTGFEMEIVPEPSTIALGVLGVGALILARRRK